MVPELVKEAESSQNKRNIKRAVRLEDVVDVTLLDAASFEYLTHQLDSEALVPIDVGGSAQIMIISSERRFLGQRFCESSISVLAQPAGCSGDLVGVYLVAAFDSNRFFAFCERLIFSTPYQAEKLGDRGGPVNLPRIPGTHRRLGFMVGIEGKTVVRPFVVEDYSDLTGCDQPGIFQPLSQSGLYPREWRIRPSAFHEKSKTYERSLLC